MENIKNLLFSLSEACFASYVDEARVLAEKELSKYAKVERLGKNTVAYMGEGDYTLMLAAHIDEVSFVVTNVDENGFLTLSKCGGIDLRQLPSRRVTIHSKEKVSGVFCSVPPHLKQSDVQFDDIKNFKVDSLLGEKAKDVISVGDIVTYCESPKELLGTRVTGKSLDDRAGVVCLLELAKRLSGKALPLKVAFCLTNEEELGLRGAKTAAFSVVPDEAIAIDVTFGDGPDVSPLEGKNLSGGSMVGVSPILSKQISDRLISLAKENNIPYGTEIMSSKTGTDGDIISVSRGGVKTGLLSVPLRNMHTPCEVIDLVDIKATCDLLEKYIFSGGIKNV